MAENIPLELINAPSHDNLQRHHSLNNTRAPTIEITTTPRLSNSSNADVAAIFRDAIATGQTFVIIEHFRARKSFDLASILDAAEGENLLMLACRHGRRDVIEEMILHFDHNFIALCKRTNKDRKTALILAAEMGHADVCRVLSEFILEKKDDAIIDTRDSGGFSALMWACYKGLLGAAEELIRSGRANVNIRADNAMTCLMWAAGRGHEEVVKLLCQNGASVNVTDKFGSTALFWACRHSRIAVAQYLLQLGANPDLAGLNGKTPLMLAAKTGNLELTNVLLTASNPNVNMMDVDGCTPTMIAAKEGHLEVVTALMHAGASLNLTDKKTDSALIYAVRAGRLEIVRKLCEGRIDINHQGQDGKTALYCAVEKMFQDIVALLLSYRADVEIIAADKNTPLLKAVKLKNAGIVEMLLNSNARLSPTDKAGDTVLHIALRQRSRKIVQLLLRNPRNARLLYKPNKHNITPYSIDEGHEQPILPQLFGTTNLNRAEHSQSLVGYELYSSSLAVMLSEPNLCTPLTVGLYARWGSGKSFVVSQLKDYLSQYALQEGIVLFRFSPLVIFLVGLIAASAGLFCTLALSRELWFIGIIVGLSVLLTLIVSLLAIWWFSRHKAAKWVINMSQKLESFTRRLSIITSVIFANPVSNTQYLQQLRFIVVNCPKFSGNVRPGGIIRAVLAEMYLQVEAAYGSLTSRLLLIFKPNETTHRSHRQFCCLPLYIWAMMWGICSYLDCLLIYAYWPPFSAWRGLPVPDVDQDTTASVFIVIFSSFSALGVVVFFFGVVCRFLYLAIRPPYAQLLASETANSVLTEEALGRLVKYHINLLARCVHAIDVFACTQTRFLVILDELDTYDQANVVHMLDVVHRYFASEPRAPFINVLVLDPHIIIKHLDQHLASSNYEGVQMTGHDYLRSVVHLPIFLQAQPTISIRQQSPMEPISTHPSVAHSQEPKQRQLIRNKTRQADTVSIKSVVSVATQRQRTSSFIPVDDSAYMTSMPNLPPQLNKGPAALSELIGSMSAEYFSDINPRTLTRVTNICAFMARLLHASGVHFNWFNLTAWVNLTEQWPYHLSWILVYIENSASNQTYELRTPISNMYHSVKKSMPANDAMRFMDKSHLKLEAALTSANPLLTLNDVMTFLRFTVNLDPYLRRMVREQANQTRNSHPSGVLQGHISPSRQVSATTSTQQLPKPPSQIVRVAKSGKPLIALSTDEICEFMAHIPNISKSNIDRYREALQENNICGPVLAMCDMSELRKAVPMTFGDWQLFVAAVMALRSQETTYVPEPFLSSQASRQCESTLTSKDSQKAALVLTVPQAIAEVHDSYVTPDSAADNATQTPMQDVYDGESVVGDLLPAPGVNESQPPISSSASANAIQNIEASLLRRAVSGMLYEEDPQEDESGGEGARADFTIGDEITPANANGNVASGSVSEYPIPDSARSSERAYTVPSSPAMSESSAIGHRRMIENSPIHGKSGTVFRVTKTTLSPVPSAVFTRNGKRTTSENQDSDEAISPIDDDSKLRSEKRPLLSE